MAHQLRREDVGFIDRAPIRVHASVAMASSPDKVWPLIADASAWWMRPLAPVVRKALTKAVTASLAGLAQLSGKSA